MLVVWYLWKHSHGFVFEGRNHNIPQLVQGIQQESSLWRSAGAIELESLWSCYWSRVACIAPVGEDVFPFLSYVSVGCKVYVRP